MNYYLPLDIGLYITPNQIDIVEKILNHPDEVAPDGLPF